MTPSDWGRDVTTEIGLNAIQEKIGLYLIDCMFGLGAEGGGEV